MKTKQPNTRRKALAILGGGLLGASQLPKAWTRPVVNAVILPAHAQTTSPENVSLPDDTPPPPPPVDLPTHFRNDIPFSRPLSAGILSPGSNNILSLLISDAQAGFSVSSGDMSIDSPDGINFTAICNINPGTTVTLTAAGQINAGPVDLISPACGGQVAGTITVSTITAAGAPYSISLSSALAGGEISAGTLPEGIGEPTFSESCPLN